MNDYALLKVGESLFWTFLFADAIASPTELSSVTFDAGALTLSSQANDLPNKQVTIKISGAVHGVTYVFTAIGVTSAGETIRKPLTLQGCNA